MSKPSFRLCFPLVTDTRSWNCQVWLARPCGKLELTPIPAPDRKPLPLMIEVGPDAAGLAAVCGSKPNEKSMRFQAKRNSLSAVALHECRQRLQSRYTRLCGEPHRAVRSRAAEAVPLGCPEEEQPVLDGRTAEGESKGVVHLDRLLVDVAGRGLVARVNGLQSGVAHEVPSRSVEIVSAAARNDVGHRPAALAELGAVGVGHDLHFGDRFGVARLEGLSADGKVIVALTVDQEVVTARSCPVDRKT